MNAASDAVAQGSEAKAGVSWSEAGPEGLSAWRVLRYAAFGSLDGFAGRMTAQSEMETA